MYTLKALYKMAINFKQAFKNALLLFAALIFSILLLEVLFRAFAPQITYSAAQQSSPKIYEKSDYMPFVLKQGAKDRHIGVYGDFNVSIKINSDGLRDYERPVSKNLKRILVLGDSMTFGFGVEMNETYPKYLESMLNKGTPKYQVFNAGYADSYSIDSYYVYLKNEGIKKFNPDIIVLGFFVYNDITDIALNEWEKDANNLPVKITSQYYDVDGQNRLRSARRVLPLLKNKMVGGIYDFLLANSHLFVFVKTTISKWLLTSNSNRVFDIQFNPKIGNQWQIDKNLLLAIKNIADKGRIQFIIVVMPVNFQIDDNLWEKYASIFGPDKVSRTKPNDLLKEFGRKYDITVIDIYDAFHNEYKQKPLFLRIDGHFNPEGHKVAAEEIYKYIEAYN